jgi:hypothetical protein
VKSEICCEYSWYNRCSTSNACSCFHMAGAINPSVCGYLWTVAARTGKSRGGGIFLKTGDNIKNLFKTKGIKPRRFNPTIGSDRILWPGKLVAGGNFREICPKIGNMICYKDRKSVRYLLHKTGEDLRNIFFMRLEKIWGMSSLKKEILLDIFCTKMRESIEKDRQLR